MPQLYVLYFNPAIFLLLCFRFTKTWMAEIDKMCASERNKLQLREKKGVIYLQSFFVLFFSSGFHITIHYAHQFTHSFAECVCQFMCRQLEQLLNVI